MMIIDYIMSMIKKTDSLTICVLQINNNKHLYYVSLNICFVIYTMFIHSKKKNLMNEIVELWKKEKEIKNKNKKLTIQSLLYFYYWYRRRQSLCCFWYWSINQSIDRSVIQSNQLPKIDYDQSIDFFSFFFWWTNIWSIHQIIAIETFFSSSFFGLFFQLNSIYTVYYM